MILISDGHVLRYQNSPPNVDRLPGANNGAYSDISASPDPQFAVFDDDRRVPINAAPIREPDTPMIGDRQAHANRNVQVRRKPSRSIARSHACERNTRTNRASELENT
jgi:hypothetical protein